MSNPSCGALLQVPTGSTTHDRGRRAGTAAGPQAACRADARQRGRFAGALGARGRARDGGGDAGGHAYAHPGQCCGGGAPASSGRVILKLVGPTIREAGQRLNEHYTPAGLVLGGDLAGAGLADRGQEVAGPGADRAGAGRHALVATRRGGLSHRRRHRPIARNTFCSVPSIGSPIANLDPISISGRSPEELIR